MNIGKFFVIDGNDGSGKNTQAQMLVHCLTKLNKKVEFLSFPRYNDTFFGKMLRQSLDGEYGDFVTLDPHLASLPYALDRWVSRNLILNTIASGGYVVCDRYVSANQIHQGGKIGDEKERFLFLTWLDELEYGQFRIPKPTVSIYLDVPLKISLELISEKNRDTVENNKKYLANSHESARWLMKERPHQWIRVRCADQEGRVLRSREDIHAEVVTKLKEGGYV